MPQYGRRFSIAFNKRCVVFFFFQLLKQTEATTKSNLWRISSGLNLNFHRLKMSDSIPLKF
jgi:hypothetical protein